MLPLRQVGFRHVGQTVTIALADTTLRITDQHGELITSVPRASDGEIGRFKAYVTKHYGNSGIAMSHPAGWADFSHCPLAIAGHCA